MHYDMIIVGGGLVGAGLAIALKETPLRIALIDARMPLNEDPRLFALNYSSCHFLMNLGLWPQLKPHAAPIKQVHVSNQGYFGAVRLQSTEIDLDSLGHVIPAKIIEAALNDELMKMSGDPASPFDLYRPATLKSLHPQEGMVTLQVTAAGEQKELKAPLVIGADGAESTVRAQLNIPTQKIDYDQSALVCRITLQRSHRAIAYERFNAKGAIAMLPLIGNECAMIWTSDKHTITALSALSDEDFLQALQKEFGYRLGRLQRTTQRFSFPLQMIRAEKMVEQGVLLLGNSAHTLHPIAAQGFNLALYEVAILVDMIKALQTKQAFLELDLEKMTKHIQHQQTVSLGFSHRLSNLFSHDSFMVNSILQLGMMGLDVVSPIKKQFVKKMLFQKGTMPQLLLSTDDYEKIAKTGY